MFDPITIIKTAGLLGVFLVIFAESGLFFGFFLPGDTLLFAAGIFASQGFFPISLLIIGSAVAAVLGDNTGYWAGRKMGRKLFEKDASFLFNKNRIRDAENFYKKHGPLTIILARFIPLIRTFAPIVAGVAEMEYKKFFKYNILGAVIWTIVVPLLGYCFGSLIPNPDQFLLPVISAIVVISFLPFIFKLIHHLLGKLR